MRAGVEKPRARLLLFLLALGLPFQWTTGTPLGAIKMSGGDVVVAFVLLLLFAGWSREVRVPRTVLPIAAFVALVIASVVLAPTWHGVTGRYDFPLSLLEMAKFLAGAAWMTVVFVLVSRQPRRHMWVFSVLSIGIATVIAVDSVILMLVTEGGARSAGTFGNANLYANYLVLNLFLGMYVVQTARGTTRDGLATVVMFVGLPIMTFALVSTASRSSVFGFALSLPLVVPWSRLRITRLRDVAPVGLAVVVFAATITVALATNTRLIERTMLAVDLVGEGRIVGSARSQLWPLAVEAVRGRPILGLGPGQFYHYSPPALAFKDIHNAYLRIAAEFGLVGLLVFLWSIAVVLRDGLRTSINHQSVASRALVAFIVATLLWGVFANAENLRTFWIGIGLLAAAVRR